jgi:hypothetical protein
MENQDIYKDQRQLNEMIQLLVDFDEKLKNRLARAKVFAGLSLTLFKP